jgi:hypothetical protein
MTIFAPELSPVRRLILRLLADNGGSFTGTEQICQAIPAARQCVQRSLRLTHKYHMVQRVKCHTCGRGHKTIWKLTEKGKRYVESK